MITGKNQDLAWPVTLKEIEVLANGIGCAPVPVKAYSLLRWHDLQEVAEPLVEDIPAVFQMVIEGLGLVLGQHDDLVYLRIDAVAQRQVDKSIDSSKGDSM